MFLLTGEWGLHRGTQNCAVLQQKSFQTVETTVKNPAQRDSFRFTPSPVLDLQLLRCGQAFIQFCSAACDCVRQLQSYGFDVRFE